MITILENYFENPNRLIRCRRKVFHTPLNMDFHLHNGFEIYFFISGNVNYLIERKVYKLSYGDLFVMNNLEIHKPAFMGMETYERAVIHFDPVVASLFSTPECNLLDCFVNRPKGEQNKINLNSSQVEEFIRLFSSLETANESTKPSSSILKLTRFIELLTFINSVFWDGQQAEPPSHVPKKLAPLLDYIDENLEKELSLNTLSQKFYIDKYYLSKLFKKSIGSNIHEYIIMKRIARAKKLLSTGMSVSEACLMSGFNDYSNFLRMFKRVVGIPPGQFKKD